MATIITRNGQIGKRAEALSEVKRMRRFVADLQTAYDGWDLLTAGARNAALKIAVKAVIVLLKNEIDKIDTRSKATAGAAQSVR